MSGNVPDAFGVMVDRCRAFVDVGRYEPAAEILSRLVADHPDSAVAWFELSRCRLYQGELAAGLLAAQEAVKADPQYAPGYHVLSRAFFDARQYPAAVTAAREGVRLAPERAMSHVMLARALQVAEDGQEEALAAAQEAVRAEPDNYMGHFESGLILARRKDGPGAVRAFEEVLRLDPHNATARANLVALQGSERLKRLTDITSEEMRLVGENPGDAALRSNIDGRLHRLLRRTRWIALACLLPAILAARVFATGDAPASLPAPLGTRMYALAVITAVVSLCCWLTFRRMPSGAWRSMRLLCRRSWLVRSAPLSAAWCLTGAVLLLAVPWAERSTLHLVTHAAWVPTVVAMYTDHAIRKLKGPRALYT
ncbi:tetratricopeptide repeat protein [Streptomyces sp. JJ38]|uniref:tetratricopeptide repeat protein n=1 Tax=Streptomyces sp. JJ38 TaxID=2738128 RepID=UPI001C56FEB4|nr:tetratricopeptide repeat protein [Streptomyces sp. JJ38]MBW1600433.1 tetratricopeptide repeat protein [Streptomyces sp. JJ38]